MTDNAVALVRQAILTVLDEANPRTPGLAWDFNDDEQRVDFADRVLTFIPAPVRARLTDEQIASVGAAVPAGRGYTERRDRAIADAGAAFAPSERGEPRPNIACFTDRIGELEEALQELVNLKDMHDYIHGNQPRDLSSPRNFKVEELEEQYRERKPKAWQRAREVLKDE